MQKKIKDLEEDIERATQNKIALIEATSQEMEQLRDQISDLTQQLQKEKNKKVKYL